MKRAEMRLRSIRKSRRGTESYEMAAYANLRLVMFANFVSMTQRKLATSLAELAHFFGQRSKHRFFVSELIMVLGRFGSPQFRVDFNHAVIQEAQQLSPFLFVQAK